MKLVKAEVPKRGIKQTKNLILLNEFIASNEKCVRIDGWEERNEL